MGTEPKALSLAQPAAMRLRYVSIYRVLGASKLAETVEGLAFVSLASGFRARLTSSPEPDLIHVDKSLALGAQLLKGLYSPDGEGTPEDRLAREIEAVRAQRTKRTSSGVFVVFEAEEDLGPAPKFDARRDCADYSVAFEGIDKSEVHAKYGAKAAIVLAALGLSLADDADRRFQKVGTVVYLVEPGTEKPIYVYNFTVNPARLSLARQLTDDVAATATKTAPAVLRAQSLARSTRLLVSSLEEATDALQAFISAWSALEIFVNASFKDTYEVRWTASALPNAEKPTLAGKFEYIASILDPANSAADGDEFRRLKGIRDKFFHAVATPRELLPTDAIQKLCMKYMKLHLAA